MKKFFSSFLLSALFLGLPVTAMESSKPQDIKEIMAQLRNGTHFLSEYETWAAFKKVSNTPPLGDPRRQDVKDLNQYDPMPLLNARQIEASVEVDGQTVPFQTYWQQLCQQKRELPNPEEVNLNRLENINFKLQLTLPKDRENSFSLTCKGTLEVFDPRQRISKHLPVLMQDIFQKQIPEDFDPEQQWKWKGENAPQFYGIFLDHHEVKQNKSQVFFLLAQPNSNFVYSEAELKFPDSKEEEKWDTLVRYYQNKRQGFCQAIDSLQHLSLEEKEEIQKNIATPTYLSLSDSPYFSPKQYFFLCYRILHDQGIDLQKEQLVLKEGTTGLFSQGIVLAQSPEKICYVIKIQKRLDQELFRYLEAPSLQKLIQDPIFKTLVELSKRDTRLFQFAYPLAFYKQELSYMILLKGASGKKYYEEQFSDDELKKWDRKFGYSLAWLAIPYSKSFMRDLTLNIKEFIFHGDFFYANVFVDLIKGVTTLIDLGELYKNCPTENWEDEWDGKEWKDEELKADHRKVTKHQEDLITEFAGIRRFKKEIEKRKKELFFQKLSNNIGQDIGYWFLRIRPLYQKREHEKQYNNINKEDAIENDTKSKTYLSLNLLFEGFKEGFLDIVKPLPTEMQQNIQLSGKKYSSLDELVQNLIIELVDLTLGDNGFVKKIEWLERMFKNYKKSIPQQQLKTNPLLKPTSHQLDTNKHLFIQEKTDTKINKEQSKDNNAKSNDSKQKMGENVTENTAGQKFDEQKMLNLKQFDLNDF